MQRESQVLLVADAIVPPLGEPGSRDRFRGRAAVLVLLLQLLVVASNGTAYALLGLWLSAAILAVFGLGGLGLLAAVRRGLPVEHLWRMLLFSSTSMEIVMAVVEPRFGAADLAWTLLFPALSLLLAGRRGLLAGSFASLLVCAATVALHRAGWTLDLQGPPTAELATYRTIALAVVFLLLTLGLELMRAEARVEAERSSQSKSAFLANMSHELRTPLNGILGMTELVLQGPLAAEQRERLELSLRSGQSLVAIIDDILTITKAENGQLRIEPCPTDVLALADDVVELNRPAAREKGLSLELERGPLPGLLRLDPSRLRQILSNLVANGVKFTHTGSVRISVQVSGDPAQLRVRVEDTGIGIADELGHRLFKPFQQLDETSTRRFGGTGLGLAISRHLARAMGGDLLCRSELGIGSVFTLLLPLAPTSGPTAAAAAAVAPAAAAAAAPAPAPSRTVPSPPGLRSLPQTDGVDPVSLPALIVEDNPVNLAVARGLMQKLGVRVETAANGLEGAQKAAGADYLLVLMDCHMPVLDGWEATRQIRSLPGARSLVPIFALTASVLPQELEKCLQAGMQECIPKPVNVAMLRGAVERATRLWAQRAVTPPAAPGAA